MVDTKKLEVIFDNFINDPHPIEDHKDGNVCPTCKLHRSLMVSEKLLPQFQGCVLTILQLQHGVLLLDNFMLLFVLGVQVGIAYREAEELETLNAR